MPDNLFFSPLGIGDDPAAAMRLKETSLDPQKGDMEWVYVVAEPSDKGFDGTTLVQPFPMTAVAGPVNVLKQGPFEAVNDVKAVFPQHATDIDRKAQRLEDG